jgi:hypothetical protein
MGVFISVVADKMSTTATEPVRIIVTPTAGRPSRFDARLEDGCVIVQASRQSFLDAARTLIGRGADPSIILEMWHDGAAHYSMRAQLAHASKLAVEDRIRGGKPPRFVPYRAFNRAAVATKNVAKRQTIDRGPDRDGGSRNAIPAAQ